MCVHIILREGSLGTHLPTRSSTKTKPTPADPNSLSSFVFWLWDVDCIQWLQDPGRWEDQKVDPYLLELQ